MRLDRLGKLFEQKYSLQALAAGESSGPRYPEGYGAYKSRGLHEYSKPGVQPNVVFPPPKMKDVEAKIRNPLDKLFSIVEEKNNILMACFNSDFKNPDFKNKTEMNAQKGFWFIQDVVSIVNWLKAERDQATLAEIREALTTLVELINENKGAGGPEAQFMHVSDLVMYVMRYHKTNVRDKDLRVQWSKARTGLSKLQDIAISIINYMNKSGGDPERITGRFTPDPTELFPAQKVDFIREFGDRFGLPDMESWQIVTEVDPSLVPKLRKLVHTLKRPYRDQAFARAPRIKSMMQGMIRKYLLSKATNQSYFETADPSLFEFEEGESEESPSVMNPQKLQEAVQKRDLEHQQRETALQDRLKELKDNEQQIKEDRERHTRKDGINRLLEQFLKGIPL